MWMESVTISSIRLLIHVKCCMRHLWKNKAKEAGIEISMDYLMDIWQQKWSEKNNEAEVQD